MRPLLTAPSRRWLAAVTRGQRCGRAALDAALARPHASLALARQPFASLTLAEHGRAQRLAARNRGERLASHPHCPGWQLEPRRHAALPRGSEAYQAEGRARAPVRLSDLRRQRADAEAEGTAEPPTTSGREEEALPSHRRQERWSRRPAGSAPDAHASQVSTRAAEEQPAWKRGEQGGGWRAQWKRQRRREDPEYAYEAAKASALGSLRRRLHSREELRQKLLEREHAPAVVERVLDRLAEVALLDDAEYAEVFSRAKWRQNKWAPARIRQELRRKGVGAVHADAALQALFGGTSHDVEVGFLEDSCADPLDSQGPDRQLLAALQQRQARMAALPAEAQRRRLGAWLARRGHSWGVASALLAQLGLA